MPVPAQVHVALKEWATVCSALEQGRQVLLLRKGGIHETSGQFQLQHPQFLLFPTYLHQNREMLKPAEHGALIPATSEPEKVTLSAIGDVTDIIQLESRAQMDALDDQHIWAKPLIDMRFNYRPDNPLYLLLVRAYRLASPVTVENTPAYAGCKSWVPLMQPIQSADCSPVLPDSAYQARRSMILDRLG